MKTKIFCLLFFIASYVNNDVYGMTDSTGALQKLLNAASVQDSTFRKYSLQFENGATGVFVNVEFFDSDSLGRNQLVKAFDQNLNLHLDSSGIWLYLRPSNLILGSQNLKWLNILKISYKDELIILEVEFREKIGNNTHYYRVRYKLSPNRGLKIKSVARGMEKGLRGLVSF